MSSRYSRCLSLSSPNMPSSSTSEKPITALSGVRSSCDMLARNSDLCALATSTCRLFSPISRNRWAFWIASADWLANLSSSSAVSTANSPGPLPPHDERSENPILAQQGHGEHRLPAVPQQLLDVRVGRLHVEVGQRLRPAQRRRPADRRLAESNSGCPERPDQLVARAVGRPDPELPCVLVELEDRPAVGLRELDGVSDDRLQHLLEVERRADRFADGAQGLKLLH